MKNNKIMITEELLASYFEGKTNAEETLMVLEALSEDKDLQEEFVLLQKINAMTDIEEESVNIIPMLALAAESEGNLCDFQCEKYILNQRGIDIDVAELSEEAVTNKWLRDKGTPLHSVGRLLEQRDLIVIRRYGAEMNDIKRALNAKNDVIAIVNNNVLIGKESSEISYHAVVVTDITEEYVTLYDPAAGDIIVECKISVFEKAWKEAKAFIARVKTRDNDYNPRPIDIEDVDLSSDLIDLREAIAENAHEIWADQRQQEGWTYGPVRDDAKKQNPDMLPYSMLPDSEREYDRRMAFDTIKLMKKLGFDIIKREDSVVYRDLYNKINDLESVRVCECGHHVFVDQNYCPNCGARLEWEIFK